MVDENGGEMQYTDVAEFLVKQMLGKFHPTDLLLMQVSYFSFDLLSPFRLLWLPQTEMCMRSLGKKHYPI